MLQIMMGSKTDEFMGDKGTEQIFGALWLLQAISKSAVVFFFSFFFKYLSSFIFRFSLGRNLPLIFVNPHPIPATASFYITSLSLLEFYIRRG